MSRKTDNAMFNDGVRYAITWLHAEARKMNDNHAKMVLNNAGFHLGVHNSRRATERMGKVELAPSGDPIESIVADALTEAGIAFERQPDHPDLWLSDYGIGIECKQFHTDRIAEQTARWPQVIVVQGREAAEALAHLLIAGKVRAVEAILDTMSEDARIEVFSLGIIYLTPSVQETAKPGA